MAVRRAFPWVAVFVALIAALLPATAFAAPQWLPGETLEAGDAGPDVTTDPAGNSAAIWIKADSTSGLGSVRVAQRPRGGPWGDPVDVDTGIDPSNFQPPKITALPNGELAAMWVKSSDVYAAQKPPGGDWSSPQLVSSSCCIEIVDLVAGADNTAMGVWYSGDGASQTATLPPDTDTWVGPQNLNTSSPFVSLAVAPDGSAEVAAAENFCGPNFNLPCIVTQHRDPGGGWVDDPTPPVVTSNVTGTSLVANPDSSFTLLWGQDSSGLGRSQVPDGSVFSADRAAGGTGTWSTPDTVASPSGEAPGCPNAAGGCIDLAGDGGGGLLAVWQQGNGSTTNEIRAALRPAGAGWTSPETVEGVPANDAVPRGAFTGNGIPVAVWNSGGTSIRGAHRDAGGWSAEQVSTPVDAISATFEDVVGDDEGNAVTGWRDGDGVSVAGFDGVGPTFRAFSISTTTVPNQPIDFSAAADDNWSGPPSISWLFGDGGSASGGSVRHAYTSGGSYTATATATDGAGNASSQSGPVTITAPPTPTPTPTPNPCGDTDRDQDGINDLCDISNGDELPKPFKTVNATVVSGDVFVKGPGGGSATAAQGAKAPKGFRRLQGAETIKVGSTVDTAKGVVLIRSAADTRRHTQIAKFNAGRFLIKQIRKPRGKSKRRSKKLITDMRLTGSSFRKACGASSSSVRATTSARRRSRKRVRRLFGDGKGTFRTTGRTAAATVRGTHWGVQDRCDGTLVRVFRGRVTVRDFARKRTVIVRAGHRYLARIR